MLFHLFALALYSNLIIGNSSWNNTNSTSGLLQNINSGLSSDEPTPGQLPNPLGSAIVIIIFVIVAAVSSFKTDLPVAAAVGALFATGVSLLLQTPGLALVGQNLPYIFGGLTLFFMFLALLAGGKNPFGR